MSSKLPPDVTKQYEVLRPLGQGAFCSVWLARPRHRTDCATHGADRQGCRCDHVAVKQTRIIGRDDPTNALLFAEREVEVLRELSHPNVVEIVHEFDYHGSSSSSSGNAEQIFKCVALSLALGPTLQDLVQRGGALGLPMARLVSRQLIKAVAYLHGRAVIHRDIKPDNIIVDGASISDYSCWSDDYGDEGVRAGECVWKVVLIDFGFAKALSPGDVDVDIGLYRTIHHAKDEVKDDEPSKFSLDLPLAETYNGQDSKWQKDMDESISARKITNMSAVGNLQFSAPEVLRSLRPYEQDRNTDQHKSERQKGNGTSGAMKNQPNPPLGEKVADYGMIADAFSVGATLRYILTGVPPKYDVSEYIALHNGPVAVTLRFVGNVCSRCFTGNRKNAQRKRVRRFRMNDELPKDAARLIRALTLLDEKKRCTVRGAQRYSWVSLSKGCSEDQTNGANTSQPGTPIYFLECATREMEGGASTTTSTTNASVTATDETDEG